MGVTGPHSYTDGAYLGFTASARDKKVGRSTEAVFADSDFRDIFSDSAPRGIVTKHGVWILKTKASGRASIIDIDDGVVSRGLRLFASFGAKIRIEEVLSFTFRIRV